MKTSNALDVMKKRYGNSAERQERLAEERVRVQAARAVYEARKAAGLTQKQLAELVGTQQSVIARLENSDYDGHTMSMLNRVARALGQRVTVRFEPVGAEAAADPIRELAAACAPIIADLLTSELSALIGSARTQEPAESVGEALGVSKSRKRGRRVKATT